MREENYNTGDASLDNARNQNAIGPKELLVVSFGTSFNDSRRLTIGAVEDAMEKAFPGYSIRRGFTSQMVIDHIKQRDGIAIDNVTEVRTLVIQPTHLMNGLEYNELAEEASACSGAFERTAVGAPLLTTDADFRAVAEAIIRDTAAYDDGRTAICFMGHGTEAKSNQVYGRLQNLLSENGYPHYYVGTVEAEPSLEDVLEAVRKGNYARVLLQPLMIVAGDHANNDMAGGEGSWKQAFEKAGYAVECRLRGLGELEAIRNLFVKHAREAMDSWDL